jgi:hypothetical protein
MVVTVYLSDGRRYMYMCNENVQLSYRVSRIVVDLWSTYRINV